MKTFYTLFFIMVSTLTLSAGSPAEDLIVKYKDLKGFSDANVRGGAMVFARPVIRKYPIGPLADNVTEVTVLKLEKASDADKKRFAEEVRNLAKKYVYGGKKDTPNGPCDVYIHLASDVEADEITVFNEEKSVFNVLLGRFPVAELKSIDGENSK